MDKEDHDYIINNQNIIFEQIKKFIFEKIQTCEWGRHIITGIAKFAIEPTEQNKCEGTPLLPYNEDINLRDIVSKAVKKADEQLQPPGVLIIETDYAIKSSFLEKIDKFLLNDSMSLKNISAIIFMDRSFEWQVHANYKHISIINSNLSCGNIKNSNIMRSLRDYRIS